jgi:hypothetical protein
MSCPVCCCYARAAAPAALFAAADPQASRKEAENAVRRRLLSSSGSSARWRCTRGSLRACTRTPKPPAAAAAAGPCAAFVGVRVGSRAAGALGASSSLACCACVLACRLLQRAHVWWCVARVHAFTAATTHSRTHGLPAAVDCAPRRGGGGMNSEPAPVGVCLVCPGTNGWCLRACRWVRVCVCVCVCVCSLVWACGWLC